MRNLKDKQSALLELLHLLWEDPGSSYQLADKYWDLRESDHLGTDPDPELYDNLVNQCCKKIVLQQVELRKLEKLLKTVL